MLRYIVGSKSLIYNNYILIKRFTLQVTIRIIAILASCVLISYLLLNNLWFSSIGIGFTIFLQVFFLIRYVNNTNYSLVKFLDALKNEDYSVYFSPSKKGDSFAKLFDDFNQIIKTFIGFLSYLISNVEIMSNPVAKLSDPAKNFLSTNFSIEDCSFGFKTFKCFSISMLSVLRP